MTLGKNGFTLVEILIVIAIVAVTSVIVLLIMNPAELLRQGRDAQRVSDMATLKSAVSLYVVDFGTSALNNPSSTYVSIPDPAATSTSGDQCQGLGLPNTNTYQCAASATYRGINGAGWIAVTFTLLSSGSPIEKLPVDPQNTTTTGLYYTFDANGASWEFSAGTESQKYSLAGARDVVSTDGGKYADRLEMGTSFALLPFDPSTNSSSTPPVISNVSASNIGTTTAQISWTTDQLAYNAVNYGLTSSYGSSSSNGSFVTNHNLSLSSLAPGTTYHYQADSNNSGGDSTSSDFTFTTIPPFATITFDASSTAIRSAGTSVNTTTITVGSGANNIIVIELGTGAVTASSTGVTVDGNAATRIVQKSNGPRDAELWYYLNASAGSHSVSSSFTVNCQSVLTVSSFFGVNQSSPLDTYSSKAAISTNPSSTVTTANVNEMIVDATNMATTTTAIGPGQNSIVANVTTSGIRQNASYFIGSTPGTYTTQYTGQGSAAFTMAQAAFNPAPQ
ncbi:MAG TPA: fibronectin type III domain-containing protein [Candidatus Paceibacterota bacterium]|nr:fibronectin type III domain-containing protein [Candidatus Paceibacterota bacterium]